MSEPETFINHKEASEFAAIRQDRSNLARCYLELERRCAALEALAREMAHGDYVAPGAYVNRRIKEIKGE